MPRRCANWLILCLALALSGCATVQIDVDAYKGPLADHNEVLFKNALFMADSSQILLTRYLARLESKASVSLDEVPGILKRCRHIENALDDVEGRGKNDLVCAVAHIVDSSTRRWVRKPGVDGRAGSRDWLESVCEPENENAGVRIRTFSEVDNDSPCDVPKLAWFSSKLITFGNSTALLLNDQQQGQGDKEHSVNERIRYTALLQNMGNSIQSALNDYFRQKDHERDSSGKFERLAQHLSLRKSAEEIHSEYLNIIQSRLDRANEATTVATKAKDSVDSLASDVDRLKTDVTRLLDEYKIMVSSKEVDTSKSLKDWPLIGVFDTFKVLHGKEIAGAVRKPVAPSDLPDSEDPENVFLNTPAAAILDRLGAGKSVRANLLRTIGDVLKERGGRLSSMTGYEAARRKAAYEHATAYVEKLQPTIEDGDAKGVYQGLLKIIEENLTVAIKPVKEKEKALELAEARYGDAARRLASARSRVSDPSSLAPSEEEIASLKAAKDALQKNSIKIIESLRKAGPDADTGKRLKAVRDALVSKQLRIDGKEKILEGLNTWLGAWKAPTPVSCCSGESARTDVMDEVVAALRHELIRAKRAGDPVQVERLESALQEAYEQRSGMIYLRPAITYLRSTTAASILQQDSGTKARNLLWHELRNAFPGSGQTARNDVVASAQEELDKQNWSNINSVKVSGGGNVNYALVKDDIGNWYVKGYAADASEVIRSAQSLGMFAMGRKLNMNILSALEQERDLKKELADAGTDNKAEIRKQLAANRTVIQDSGAINGVFDKFSGLYGTKTQAIAGDAAAAMKEDALKGNIVSGWSGAVGDEQPFKDDLKSALDAAYTAVKSDVETQAADLGKKGITSAGIVDAAKMLRAFSAKLRATLGGADSNIGKKLADKVIAQKKASDGYGAALKAHKEALMTTDAGVIKTSGDNFINTQQALAAANGDLNQYKAKVNVALEAADRKVYGLIRSMVSKQFEAASEFETAIIYLGEASSSKGKQ